MTTPDVYLMLTAAGSCAFAAGVFWESWLNKDFNRHLLAIIEKQAKELRQLGGEDDADWWRRGTEDEA